MTTKGFFRILGNAGLLGITAVLAGCLCPKCDSLTCGNGTMEEMVGGQRTCVATPVSCGGGTQEQPTGAQRECVPVNTGDILECGAGTYEHEQAPGGPRACVSGASSCPAGQIEVLNTDGTKSCKSGTLACGDGTQEQAIGGQRECVVVGSDLACGTGTQEQAVGGQRECQPVP